MMGLGMRHARWQQQHCAKPQTNKCRTQETQRWSGNANTSPGVSPIVGAGLTCHHPLPNSSGHHGATGGYAQHSVHSITSMPACAALISGRFDLLTVLVVLCIECCLIARLSPRSASLATSP
jgi:hypothetical protein